MSYTIHFEMALAAPDDFDIIFGMISEKASQLGWKSGKYMEGDLKGIYVDTCNDECETLSIAFDGLACEGFVKYLGIDKDFVWSIFDVFWLVKPCLEKLFVIDEMSLWEEYCSEKTS